MPSTHDDLVKLIRRMGIDDPRLIDAFRRVPREAFLPADVVDLAYEDRPLPIPRGQVTTQPSLSAQMIEALELSPTDRLLEVGTGYGFQTALLASLAARVVSIERWPDLADAARENLARQGIGNVEVRVGDGTKGAADAAPFEAVLVSAAFPEVPASLAAQLAEGGRLVQPIGPGGREDVVAFRKEAGELRRVRTVVPASFVRLVGEEAYPGDQPERGGR